VTERQTAPELLRPESIHFEAIDEELFELVQQAKRTPKGNQAHAQVTKRLAELDLTSARTSSSSSSLHVQRADAPKRPLTSAELFDAEERALLACWRSVGPPEWLLFRYRPRS